MPASTFDHSDQYLFGTSETGPSIVCWDVAMQRVVNKITPHPAGHSKVVVSGEKGGEGREGRGVKVLKWNIR